MKLGQYTYAKPRTIDIQVDRFNDGVNTIQRAMRLKPTESAEALNLMLVEDGLWSPRWGTQTYGGAIAGASQIDGFSEFVKSDGTRELIVVASGKVWRHGAVCVEITGATFTAGTQVFFKQIGGYLYIANGTDPVARYNGTTLTTYTEIVAPSNVQLTGGAGISTGSYNYYIQVTALNSIGETVGSTEVTRTVHTPRENWTAETEYVTSSWDAVNGATRYQVYYSDESGYEVLLSTTETNSYKDDNTATPNPYVSVPDANTTGGPLFTQMELSGNRLYGTKDPNNKYRVYGSGTGPNIGIFSDFYGGFWIDLEKGGRTQPQAVVDYRDGQGNSRPTIVCSNPEGTGSIWQIELTTATVGDVTFTVPSAVKVVGSLGTNASRSVVLAHQDVYFLNIKMVGVLGNEKQFWGVLRTNELSVQIRPYIESLSDSVMDKACAYYFNDKVFFSASTNGSTNNRIFYYDRENTSWVIDWSIGVTQFGEYTDPSGVTHFLGGSTSDGYLIEFSKNIIGDRGVAFTTRYVSPQFPVDKAWNKFAKLDKCYIKVANPRGTLGISILGTGKANAFSTVATGTLTSASSATGLGFDPLGSVPLGDSDGTPTTFAIDNTQRFVKLNSRVRDVQIRIETTCLDNGYTLVGFRVTGNLLDTTDPSSEKL